MSHRHVVICDQCETESHHLDFGAWLRISPGGELTGEQIDLCSTDCAAKWLREEADRIEAGASKRYQSKWGGVRA